MTDKILLDNVNVLQRIEKLLTEALKIKASDKGDSISSSKQSSNRASGKADIASLIEAASKFDSKAEKNTKKFLNFYKELKSEVIDKIDKKSMESFATLTTGVSSAILGFGKSMALATPLYILATPGLLLMKKTFEILVQSLMVIGEIKNPKRIKESLDAILLYGKVATQVVARIALVTPLLILAIPGVFGLRLVMGLFLESFDLVGKKFGKDKDVKNGISVLKDASYALLIFAGSLALSTLLMIPVISNPLGILTLFGTLAISALVFGLIGNFEKEIGHGALAVVFMSLSLDVFALSLAFSAKQIEDVGVKQLGIMALALGGTALIFGLAGMFWEKISLGALAFAFVGLALMLIANPIETISKVVGENADILWKLPVLLGELGLAFGLAGLFVIPIGLGAAAFGLIGGGLWALGKGLEAIVGIPDFSEDKIDSLEYAIKGVVQGFAHAFDGISLVDALSLPLKIPVVAGLGLALIPLAMGIKAWSKVSDGWGEQETDNLKYTISEMSKAYATAGSTKGMSSLFGFSVGDNDVERGIESTEKMGKNLKMLADGISAWKTMKLTEEDLKVIANNISKVLNTIPFIFASIGERDRLGKPPANSSFLGSIFGSDLAKGDIEAGIDSTLKLGENLKGLADGIKAWQTGGKEGITPAMIENVKVNVGSLLATLPSIFAEIGKKDKESSGIFPWSDGDIEAGVELVGDLADPLEKLSKTLLNLKDVQNPVKTGTAFGLGIKMLMWQLRMGLAAITDKDIEKLEKLTKPVEKFSKVIKDLGAFLKDNIQYFAKFDAGYLKSFSVWADALYKISEIKSANLESNFGYSKNLLNDVNQKVSTPQTVTIAESSTIGKTAKQAVVELPKEDKMQKLMELLITQFESIATAMTNQSKELQAIKLKLNDTIKTKESTI